MNTTTTPQTLRQFLAVNPNKDYDMCDTVYDVMVGVCDIGEPDDVYDEMCSELMDRLKVVRTRTYHDGYSTVTCDIAGFVEENYHAVMRPFGNEHSRFEFPEDPTDDSDWEFDEDDPIYVGVLIIIDLLTGNYSEESARHMLQFLRGEVED